MNRRKIGHVFFRTICFFALLFIGAVVVLVWDGRTERLGHADVALVPGNKVNADGSPSPRLKARLDKTIALYNRGYFKTIIVSGAMGKEGVLEGTAMKDYLVRSGIPDSAVLVDNEGVDTYASAKNTADILRQRKGKSIFIVTQYFHIPRTRLALEKFGLGPIFSAYPSYFEARDVYSTARELPAYGKYLLRRAESDGRMAR